jgi:predicted nucleotidyltransferase/HEPN domain-containing protein
MNTSLAHLPEAKQARLAAMAAAIREAAPAELVLLFGSHARGNWVEDPETGYMSDFDLLVVVESPAVAEKDELWSEVERRIRPLAAPTPVTLVVHDIKFLNREIRRGQYFFSEIVAEGVLLHTSKRFDLARPKASTPEERKALAQEYFDHWFTSAGRFFVTFEHHLAHGWNPEAAFELHQATERYYAAALLVFTGYKPVSHDIETLGEQVGALHPDLHEPIPKTLPEDERLFKLLKKAYIEARYSRSYRVTAEELAILGERVRGLAGRIERACREKIASFV